MGHRPNSGAVAPYFLGDTVIEIFADAGPMLALLGTVTGGSIIKTIEFHFYAKKRKKEDIATAEADMASIVNDRAILVEAREAIRAADPVYAALLDEVAPLPSCDHTSGPKAVVSKDYTRWELECTGCGVDWDWYKAKGLIPEQALRKEAGVVKRAAEADLAKRHNRPFSITGNTDDITIDELLGITESTIKNSFSVPPTIYSTPNEAREAALKSMEDELKEIQFDMQGNATVTQNQARIISESKKTLDRLKRVDKVKDDLDKARKAQRQFRRDLDEINRKHPKVKNRLDSNVKGGVTYRTAEPVCNNCETVYSAQQHHPIAYYHTADCQPTTLEFQTRTCPHCKKLVPVPKGDILINWHTCEGHTRVMTGEQYANYHNHNSTIEADHDY